MTSWIKYHTRKLFSLLSNYLVPLCIVSLLIFPTNVQSVNLDSLWMVWQDESQNDSIRLKALDNYIWEGYLFSQPDSAFYYAKIQYVFAQKKGVKKSILNALNLKGLAMDYLGKNKEALHYFQQSIALGKEFDDKEAQLVSYSNIASIYREQGRYKESIEYYLRCLSFMEEIGDKRRSSAVLGNIGLVYFDLEDYETSLIYFTKCLVLGEELKNKRIMATALLNIGLSHMYQNNYELANEFYKRSQEIMEEIGDNLGLALLMNNIGNNYARQGDDQNAMIFFKRSLTIYQKIQGNRGKSLVLTNIGGNYLRQRDYYGAKEYGDLSLKLAKETGNLRDIQEAYELLYLVHEKLNNNKLALDMLKLYTQTRDSITKGENQKEVIRLEYKYEYEKQSLADSLAFAQQKELDQLTHKAELDKKENQRYALITGLCFLLVLGALGYRGYQRKQKITKLENEKLTKNLETQQRDIINVIVDGEMRTNFQKTLLTKIETLISDKDQSVKDLLKPIRLEIKSQINLSHRLSILKSDISRANANFDKSLLELCPNLSKTEREICSFIRLNLSIKEIAQIKGATTGSVKTLRSRVRKKLELDGGTELDGYIQSI